MRIAIISDIHGNYEALLSVHEDIQKSEVDKIVCLGDFIGYGPQPEEVAQFLMENDIPCVLGNHENGIIDRSTLINFTEDAMISIEISRGLISDKTLQYISNLPTNLIIGNMLFVHGAPPESINTYLTRLSDDELQEIVDNLEQQFAFIGHTHDPLCCFYDGNIIDFQMVYRGITQMDANVKSIINVGSVGQPRDGNSDAKYVIFDDTEFTADLRSVKYDIDKTADLLAKKNFPKYNAERLYQNWIEVLS
ncbi:metallophosphatase family protein [Desulfosarcina sp.]|nr:metallophosphatase family protein [Desulfosarcina sp.]